MLVLSRESGEAVQVGGGIAIKVLHSRRGRVRLGIEAPAHMRIMRSEHLSHEDTRRKTGADSASAAEASCLVAPGVNSDG